MKRITKLDSYIHIAGYAALAMTVVLAGMGIYNAVKQLF